MIVPDFREYKGRGNELLHSAKGTTWGKHKYISKKFVNGNVRYIYGGAINGKERPGSYVDVEKRHKALKVSQAKKAYDELYKKYKSARDMEKYFKDAAKEAKNPKDAIEMLSHAEKQEKFRKQYEKLTEDALESYRKLYKEFYKKDPSPDDIHGW